MERDQKIVITALLAIPGIGVQTFLRIQQWCQFHNLSVTEWWGIATKSVSVTHELRLSDRQRQALVLFQNCYTPESYTEYLDQAQIKVLWEKEAEYPRLLKAVVGHPIILFTKGPLNVLAAQTLVGVVGTRKITAYGELVTQAVTRDLVKGGACIVSGAMYGVDMCAHRTAIDQAGRTIGVLGFGFGQWHPSTNYHHQELLLDGGALLMSEYPPGMPPQKGTFLQRNRIIAGLGEALVVTEAAARSGSLNTAHTAAEYGRDVWAVPGPITSPYSEGVKNLINEGAKLLSSGFDIWENQPQFMKKSQALTDDKSAITQPESVANQIITILKNYPASTDQVQEQLCLPVQEVLSALSLLEIKKVIKRKGSTWSKI